MLKQLILFFATLTVLLSAQAALDCQFSYRGPVIGQSFTELTVKLSLINQLQTYRIFSAELQGQTAYANFDTKSSELQLQIINSKNDKQGVVSSGILIQQKPQRLSLITENTSHILSCQLNP